MQINSMPFLEKLKSKGTKEGERKKKKNKKHRHNRRTSLDKSESLLHSGTSMGNELAMLEQGEIDMNEELNDDSDHDKGSAEEYESDSEQVKLISLQEENVDFDEAVAIAMIEQRDKTALAHRKRFMLLYSLGLLTLLAYSLVIWYTTSSDGSEAFLGCIVSVAIVFLDGLLYAYSSTGRITSDESKLLIMASTRVLLISFGQDEWLIGICFVYFIAGIYLVYAIVDTAYTYIEPSLVLKTSEAIKKHAANSQSNEPMKLSQFVRYIIKPSISPPSNPLLDTIKRSSNINIPAFIFILLTIAYFMCVSVAYINRGPAILVDGNSADIFQQYLIGIAVFALVILIFFIIYTVRRFQITAWKLNRVTFSLFFITQLLFVLVASVCYLELHSIIVITFLLVSPFLLIALLGTYTQCITMDFQILMPPETRSPPYSPFLIALLCCGLNENDYKMACGLIFTFGSMSIIGFIISFLVTPSYIGWSISFVMMILLTSLMPAAKYLHTLALDAVDQLSIFLFLCLHAAFFVLLSYTLAPLSDLDLYILWCCCAAYPVGLLFFVGVKELREAGWRFTYFTRFAIGIAFVTVGIMGGMSLYWIDRTIGFVILGSLLGFLICASVALVWIHRNYSLPLWLRIITSTFFIAVFGCGIVLGIYLTDPVLSFWAFSVCFFIVIFVVS